MGGFLRGFLYGVVLIAAGWLFGSIYPAPPLLTGHLKTQSDAVLASIDFSPEGLSRLREALSPEEFDRLSRDAATLAAQSGSAVIVERDEEALAEIAAVHDAAPEAPSAGVSAFEDSLFLCPGMTVTNAPPADADRRVQNYAPRVDVNGVALAAAPTLGACLSSGFGPRNGRQHRGIDLHSGDGGPILAAADGVVLEKKYRDDYGNMLLIDHGNGVHTRYAHLSSFARDIIVGARVSAGQEIGLMGNTASYRIPIHLHYEVLIGDYNTRRGSFGLEARSPFSFPAAR